MRTESVLWYPSSTLMPNVNFIRLHQHFTMIDFLITRFESNDIGITRQKKRPAMHGHLTLTLIQHGGARREGAHRISALPVAATRRYSPNNRTKNSSRAKPSQSGIRYEKPCPRVKHRPSAHKLRKY